MEDGELMETRIVTCPECGAEILVSDEVPEVDWGRDPDFYDGVEEKEEKERMEDRGEMDHEPY